MKKVFLGILLMLSGLLGAFAEGDEVFVIGAETLGFIVQMNPEHPMLKKKDSGFVNIVGPVEKGSAFKVVYEFPKKTEKSFELRSVLFETSESILQKEYDFVVVPNERNIFYFWGRTTLDKFVESVSMEKIKDSTFAKARIVKPLKKAIKQYSGTEWESNLKAELEVWE